MAEEGLRKDEGKLRLDLIPAEWVEGLGAVLTFGAQKYEDRNWEKGMAWGKCLGPGLRHVFKWVRGETYDEESGLHHLYHAAWNFLALAYYQERNLGTDDRGNPKDRSDKGS